jgi:hypothetical protein
MEEEGPWEDARGHEGLQELYGVAREFEVLWRAAGCRLGPGRTTEGHMSS